jgi:hypothetical protein
VSADSDLVRRVVAEGLRLHPRVAYQGLFSEPSARAAMAAQLPDLVPFGDHHYQELVAMLDWDHRLPSKSLVLRIYAYYEPRSAARGRESFDLRTEDIAERDRYPEFDVPDYEGLLADEAYESSVELKGTVERPRLVSEWRRQVEAVVADECVELVRASREFRGVARPGVRPGGLGDLEAVAWCPPCESDYPDWTVDVWYLTEFDGLLGKGYSFMVDPRQHRVAMAREFVVRAAPSAG